MRPCCRHQGLSVTLRGVVAAAMASIRGSKPAGGPLPAAPAPAPFSGEEANAVRGEGGERSISDGTAGGPRLAGVPRTLRCRRVAPSLTPPLPPLLLLSLLPAPAGVYLGAAARLACCHPSFCCCCRPAAACSPSSLILLGCLPALLSAAALAAGASTRAGAAAAGLAAGMRGEASSSPANCGEQSCRAAAWMAACTTLACAALSSLSPLPSAPPGAPLPAPPVQLPRPLPSGAVDTSEAAPVQGEAPAP